MTATAPAREITVTDALDPDLDLDTFALTEITFANHTITVPDGLDRYEAMVPLTLQGHAIVTEVQAGLDRATRTLTLTLRAYDPATGWFSEDPLVGLLYPNDGTLRGQGSISYRVSPLAGLPSGTVIDNRARIVFDYNDPIDTPLVFNTLDTAPPTSQVNLLPPSTTITAIPLSWSGQDDTGGSGIAIYTIWVSVDGGEPFPLIEDTTDTSATVNAWPGHSYAFYSVASDHVGHVEAPPSSPDATVVIPPALVVEDVTPTSSGFTATLQIPFSPLLLNLYDSQTSNLGPADVTLVGTSTGPVQGSLIIGADHKTITFIKTGGVLAPDTYTVTLRSAPNGFSDGLLLLDGNADGTTGDDFVTTFAIDAPSSGTVIVSVPDVVRGPSQSVNIPGDTTNGLPIRLSDGSGITEARFDLVYDPTLLTISGIQAAPGLPAGWSVVVDLSVNGLAQIHASGATPLSAGTLELVRLLASVPYTTKQVLDLTNTTLKAGSTVIPALDDDAIHVAAYQGDLNGDGQWSAGDVTALRRALAGLDGGFATYQLADPAIVGDTSNNQAFTSVDVTQLRRAIVGLSTSLPSLGSPGQAIVGPDPIIFLPRDLQGAPGQVLQVPVKMTVTDPQGAGLAGFDLAIQLDPKQFQFQAVRLSPLLRGLLGGPEFDLIHTWDPQSGILRLTASSLRGDERFVPDGETIDLVWLDVRVRANAQVGTAALNLRSDAGATFTNASDGQGRTLLLSKAPTNGAADAVDGLVRIRRASPVGKQMTKSSVWLDPVVNQSEIPSGLLTLAHIRSLRRARRS